MLEKLRQELPRLGFEPITPVESTSPIVTFAKQDTSKDGAEVEGTNIDIAVYPHRIRISPSVYNDMADGNRLLEAIT